nr:hypothetical protein [Streptomyces turgidiscabies]
MRLGIDEHRAVGSVAHHGVQFGDGAARVHRRASGSAEVVQVKGDDAYGDVVGFGEFQAAELVSNAVRHTKGPAALRVRWSAGVLRIGAWDADPRPPEPPQELAQLVEADGERFPDVLRPTYHLHIPIRATYLRTRTTPIGGRSP